MALKSNLRERSHTVKPTTPKTSPKPAEGQPASAQAAQRAAVDPAALRTADVAALQRTWGNAAVQRMLAEQPSEPSEPKLAGESFDDFDGKQYRVTGRPPNRKIEEVKRREEPDAAGKPKPVYYATGEVVGFRDQMPLVSYYPEPVSLGDWYPSVTHLNGMNVAPESGLNDAATLQDAVNQSLDAEMGGEGVALQQSAIDVLYTYSAKRSNFFLDLFDCIKGKVGVKDQVTESQETLMLDAVRQRRRVTVSAHSRGTIKTNNAVKAVYKRLIQEYQAETLGSADAQAAYAEAVENAERWDEAAMLDPSLVGEIAREEKAKQLAAKRAEADMNAYIQLIYAGNAVEFPSTVLKAELFVGKKDFVSFLVGTYSKWGAQLKSGEKATMHKVSGGHGFGENYVHHVAEKIAEDLAKR